MADEVYRDRLERWANKVLDDSARLSRDLTEAERRELETGWYADFYTLEDGWLIKDPDDPAMRDWLIEEEGMSPDFADQVLAKMRELATAP
jgi:hypothetical protein